jgi:hypothetical protein
VSFLEDIGRYVDGTLQDRDVHTCDVEFTRVPGSGRETGDGFSCDFDVLLQGKRARVTVSVTKSENPS